MTERFDKAYYDRFYRNPETRAVTPAVSRRQAAFVAAYLKHLQIPVRRILDIGCGTGATLRALGKQYPRAVIQGVEISAYLCKRYGWQQGSVVDYQAATPCDLVVCHDVLAYLNATDCARAIANLARLSRAAACLGILTADDAERYDPKRTDSEQYLRPASWYRKHLRPHFVNIGGGLYLKRPPEATVWAMEQLF